MYTLGINFFSLSDQEKEFTSYSLFIHEGIHIDVKFHNLDQFLEFKEKTSDNDIRIAAKNNKERKISRVQIIKTIIVEKRVDSIPLLSYMNENLTKRDNSLINSLLKIPIDDFLNFFTLRRLDEEFSDRFDGSLSMLVPAKVILNGLDDKVYKASNEYDIEEISPYHKARKQETLQKLFPISGAIEIHYLSNRFKKY